MTIYKRKSVYKKLLNALNGVSIVFREESNFRVQAICFFFVCVAAAIVDISRVDFLVILLISSLVFVAEIFNSAIENLCDHITLDEHIMIKKIKDISAGGVLVVSLFALITGVSIFAPYMLNFFL